MRLFISLGACLLVAAITDANAASCTFHVQMTHALPPGAVTSVRVVALGGTRIANVVGYAWGVQASYPSSATLIPPSTGPENLSMISVEIDAAHSTGVQRIDIQWLGGKPQRMLCHRTIDVACGKIGPLDPSTSRTERTVSGAVGMSLDCSLVSAEIVADGPIDHEDPDCDPSFEIQALGCNTYAFHNTTEYDVIGPPAQYTWTVVRDDGSTEVPIPLANPNAENPIVTFPGPGTYIVELQPFGAPCGNDSDSAVEEIVIPDLGADFMVAHFPAQAFAVQLTNESSGNALSYSWNFGDNTPPATTPNPTHAFAGPGFYNICLTAASTGGCQSQNCKSFKVSADCSIDFKWSYTGCPDTAVANGYDVHFENTSAATSSGTIYHWDFGDGDVLDSTAVTITHHYVTEGPYTVTLSDPFNTSCVPKSQTVTLHTCAADFIAEECQDGKVIVTTSSPSPSWNFPGGSPSDGAGSPAETQYSNNGIHPITMISEDESHCRCQVTKEVTSQDLKCRKNQTERDPQTFDYNGNQYRVRLKFTVRNLLFAHWVGVKMVVKKKNKWGIFRRNPAAELNIQWGGTIYRDDPDIRRCHCSVPESVSDSVQEADEKKAKKKTHMNGRFWSRKESLQATYFVKIDPNDSGRSFGPLQLSKP